MVHMFKMVQKQYFKNMSRNEIDAYLLSECGALLKQLQRQSQPQRLIMSEAFLILDDERENHFDRS